MKSIDSPQEILLAKRLEGIQVGGFEALESMPAWGEEARSRAFAVLLDHACDSQHFGSITAGRRAIARIPLRWLEENLFRVAADVLDLEDEWVYRRLLELVREVAPSIQKDFIDKGLASSNPDVASAASDFSNER